MTRQAAKTDDNQPEIVVTLRQVGATVQCLHRVGDGTPDLLVGFRGSNYLIEVKSAQGKLNGPQQRWHEDWMGQVAQARDPLEALRVIGAVEADNG